jgi:hypothetical protein
MAKRAVKKRFTKKKIIQSSPVKASNVDRMLAENFISFQKVMIGLSGKFEDLTKKISQLLELFEVSAKTLAQKEFETPKGEKKEILEKIDALLDQNKTLARGITMVYENLHSQGAVPMPLSFPRGPVPFQNPAMPQMKKESSVEGYEKSLVIKEPTESQHTFQNAQKPAPKTQEHA